MIRNLNSFNTRRTWTLCLPVSFDKRTIDVIVYSVVSLSLSLSLDPSSVFFHVLRKTERERERERSNAKRRTKDTRSKRM